MSGFTLFMLTMLATVSVLASETYQSEADISTDGEVSFLDIAPFIATLAGL